MNINKVSIATITWARTEDEEQLLKKSLEQLTKFSIPVFITDGGSGKSFLDFLQGFPQFTILKPRSKGLWTQVKSSLDAAYASGSDFVLYTEPDKLEFFQNHLLSFAENINADELPGVILAARSQNGFLTFPPFQRMTETTINNCCEEIIGIKTDYSYGPFILNRMLIPYLLSVEEDIGWGWRPLAFGIVHRLDRTIQVIEKDFFCPEDQREENAEERLHRIRQLQQNVLGILLSQKILLADKV
ncbi:MAG TPA: hypothetical protein VF623_06055 [Segetibacter sp.]